MSFHEQYDVEVVGSEIIHCADFETALSEFLRLRDYDVQLKLWFTGAEWEEE